MVISLQGAFLFLISSILKAVCLQLLLSTRLYYLLDAIPNNRFELTLQLKVKKM